MLSSKIQAMGRKRRSGNPDDKAPDNTPESSSHKAFDKRQCMETELNDDINEQQNQDGITEKTTDGAGDECSKFTPTPASKSVCESGLDAPTYQISPTSSTTLPARSAQPLADVMKEIGNEAQLLQSTWAEMFTESENFELFCPKRLEKILNEVKELERNLLQQKEVLHQRLQVLSHMLNI